MNHNGDVAAAAVINAGVAKSPAGHLCAARDGNEIEKGDDWDWEREMHC